MNVLQVLGIINANQRIPKLFRDRSNLTLCCTHQNEVSTAMHEATETRLVSVELIPLELIPLGRIPLKCK